MPVLFRLHRNPKLKTDTTPTTILTLTLILTTYPTPSPTLTPTPTQPSPSHQPSSDPTGMRLETGIGDEAVPQLARAIRRLPRLRLLDLRHNELSRSATRTLLRTADEVHQLASSNHASGPRNLPSRGSRYAEPEKCGMV